MKFSKLFRQAAVLIDTPIVGNNNHKHCCRAIREACGWYKNEYAARQAINMNELFGLYFQPAHISMEDFWFGHPWPNTSKPVSITAVAARKEHRIMAMLFMAEIAKDLK